MTSFSLKLIVLTEELAVAFRKRFETFESAEVLTKRWEEAPQHDCFVTAGNCFGLMSAGIDAAVVNAFGPQIESTIQLRIMNEYLGEQPIGSAFITKTGDARVPLLCHAPTMRIPGSITGTDHAYLATRAALLAVYHWNRTEQQKIESVAMPAMGSGFGGLTADESARQMAVAYRLFLDPPYPPDWDRVVRRELLICTDGKERRVKNP